MRLYYYDRLLELLVAAALRGHTGISLQHIRRIVTHLRDAGYEAPLRELVFAVSGSLVYFRHPDGSWSGDPAPDQTVLHQVLDLEPLKAQIRRAGETTQDQIGRVERRRASVGSKPVFAGTRLPVAKVKSYIDHGFTTQRFSNRSPS